MKINTLIFSSSYLIYHLDDKHDELRFCFFFNYLRDSKEFNYNKLVIYFELKLNAIYMYINYMIKIKHACAFL